ncbi:MAG: ABC transporter permease [Alicyclobacillus sp.]|nr:ABC transporter permease [Alicyclobacillus sp.]
MLWTMVMSELRTRYKGSVLGFLWTFLNPLLLLVVYSVVFSTIMRINLPHYAAFLMIGLLSWNMFATTVQSASGVVIRQASLVKKIYFPRQILPLAVVGGSVINFGLSLTILLPFIVLSGYRPNAMWLVIIPVVLLEAVLTAGFSMLLAAVTVFLRDLEHILGILLMALFYLTPVVYPMQMVPPVYRELIKLNPMTGYVVSLHSILYSHTPLHWKLCIYSAVFAMVAFFVGWAVFDRLGRRFAEEV